MNHPIIVIAGPTASGKTAVAAALCRKAGGEIISADSRQVYRYLDVGTNKSGTWEEFSGARVFEGVPQYLTDLVEPTGTFSSGDFVKRANEAIAAIRERGRLPVIVGGTGLYIKALIDGLAPLPQADEKVRGELHAILREKGKEELERLLREVDPESAERNRGNPQRLVRALEVYRLTGKPITELHRMTVPSPERFAQFALEWKREELNAVIERRTAAMLEGGMLEETARVLGMGYPEDCPGLQSIGYRSVIGFLGAKTSREELEASITLDTRQYAKRQMTWFRRDERIRWIPVDRAGFDPERIAESILKLYGI